MGTFLLLLILAGLVVIIVRLLQLGERLKAIESPGASQTASNLTPDPAFASLNGENLWQTLSGTTPLDATTLASLREAYRPVLERHLEELFLEGVLDARQGVRVTPFGKRSIRGMNGTVDAWIPDDTAQAVYAAGHESVHATAASMGPLGERLGSACQEAHERIGLSGGEGLAARLLPRSAPSAAAIIAPPGDSQ